MLDAIELTMYEVIAAESEIFTVSYSEAYLETNLVFNYQKETKM